MAFLKLELLTFFNMVLMGIFIGLIFDLYRVFRWKVRLKRLFVDLGDLLFSLLITLITFVILIYSNGGEVRLYIFLGIILGQIIYYSTISSFVVDLYRLVLNLVYSLSGKLKEVIFLIFRKIKFWFLRLKRFIMKVSKR